MPNVIITTDRGSGNESLRYVMKLKMMGRLTVFLLEAVTQAGDYPL
jgi:hypothetical protein